ncbi:RloB family protein [Actinoallomurus spadix]|uniref:RloB family protein n=1 Tax=Actinoallomurus spadix TaxID=79912 RepID=UPI002093426D|nr:RloB family protein [Actinoallomurus spadix]MCO5984950.1 RloB family protein [Actinoallomurus spadix]
MACEGESTEPDYLEYLNERYGDTGSTPFRIQPIYRKNGMLPSETVEAVSEIAAEDEAWALFDRDEHHDILKAVKGAAAGNVDLAFSHPSFDLWLLLHFQAFGGTQSGSSKLVIEKLRQTDAAFKDYGKRGDKSIEAARRDALERNQDNAVARARGLVKSCPHGSCAPGRAVTDPVDRDAGTRSPQQWAARSGHAPDCPLLVRDPSTDVWRLLVSLGIHPTTR